MKRIPSIVAAAAGSLWLAACSDTLSSDAEGGISLSVQITAAAQGQPIDAVRIRVVGPTNRVVNSMPGEEEVIDGLAPGAYVVALEGLFANEVDLFGETTVTVNADQTSNATVVWDTFRPTANNLPPVIAEASFDVTFSAVEGAVGYTVEWDTHPDFISPTIIPTNTTRATITGALGIISIRVRAVTEFGTLGAPSDPLMVEVAPAGTPSASRSTVVPNSVTVIASSGSNIVNVTVTVLDVNDDPVPGASMTLSVSGGGNTVTSPQTPTNASGQATGSFSSTVAEEKTITATADGVVMITQTAMVAVTPGPPADVQYVQGDDQITPLLGLAPESPTVRVVDAFDNPVPDIAVTFAQTQGDGQPETPVVSTGADGLATTAWRMGIQETQSMSATEPATGTSIAFMAAAHFTGTGTATIDGTVEAGEWDGATCIPFAANVPEGGTVPAELCGMTDASNLYVQVRVVRNPNPASVIAFFIDASGDGTFGRGDDYIQLQPPNGSLQDWHYYTAEDDPICPSLCSIFDTSRDGTNDGTAAYVHDGTAGIAEMSHPLSSGDVLDMDFAAGSLARVTLTFGTCTQSNCSDIAYTFVPGETTVIRLYVQ